MSERAKIHNGASSSFTNGSNSKLCISNIKTDQELCMLKYTRVLLRPSCNNFSEDSPKDEKTWSVMENFDFGKEIVHLQSNQ